VDRQTKSENKEQARRGKKEEAKEKGMLRLRKFLAF
jgi:hypothetical protein